MDNRSDLAKLWIARGLEGESKVSESWNDIIASRHVVRVRQWLASILAIFCSFVALTLIPAPIVLARPHTNFMDWLLAGSVLGLVLMLTGGAIWRAMQARGQMARLVLLLGIGCLTTAPIVLILVRLGSGGAWWHGVITIIGFSLLVPSLALAYHQLTDLVDPMGWVSALERAIVPTFRRWLESGIESEPEQTREILEVRTPQGAYITDSEVLGFEDGSILRAFAKELRDANWDMTEARWGNSFYFGSYPSFRAARNLLEQQGLVRKAGERSNAPFVVTAKGRAVFSALAEEAE